MTAPVESVVVLGAGGHAKVSIEVLREHHPGLRIIGCVSEPPRPEFVLGVPVIGGDETLPLLAERDVQFAFIGVGANAVRLKLAALVDGAGLRLISAVSPKAAVSPTATIGNGCLLMPGSIINADARLSDLVIVNTNASVDHECTIGRAAHIAPGVTLCGNVKIGERALIGAGAVILPGIEVLNDAVVGAGAVVSDDVPAGATVVGVPARVRVPRPAR